MTTDYLMMCAFCPHMKDDHGEDKCNGCIADTFAEGVINHRFKAVNPKPSVMQGDYELTPRIIRAIINDFTRTLELMNDRLEARDKEINKIKNRLEAVEKRPINGINTRLR